MKAFAAVFTHGKEDGSDLLDTFLFGYQFVFILIHGFLGAIPPELPENLLNLLELNVEAESLENFVIFSEGEKGFDFIVMMNSLMEAILQLLITRSWQSGEAVFLEPQS